MFHLLKKVLSVLLSAFIFTFPVSEGFALQEHLSPVSEFKSIKIKDKKMLDKLIQQTENLISKIHILRFSSLYSGNYYIFLKILRNYFSNLFYLQQGEYDSIHFPQYNSIDELNPAQWKELIQETLKKNYQEVYMNSLAGYLSPGILTELENSAGRNNFSPDKMIKIEMLRALNKIIMSADISSQHDFNQKYILPKFALSDSYHFFSWTINSLLTDDILNLTGILIHLCKKKIERIKSLVNQMSSASYAGHIYSKISEQLGFIEQLDFFDLSFPPVFFENLSQSIKKLMRLFERFKPFIIDFKTMLNVTDNIYNAASLSYMSTNTDLSQLFTHMILLRDTLRDIKPEIIFDSKDKLLDYKNAFGKFESVIKKYDKKIITDKDRPQLYTALTEIFKYNPDIEKYYQKKIDVKISIIMKKLLFINSQITDLEKTTHLNTSVWDSKSHVLSDGLESGSLYNSNTNEIDFNKLAVIIMKMNILPLSSNQTDINNMLSYIEHSALPQLNEALKNPRYALSVKEERGLRARESLKRLWKDRLSECFNHSA